MEVTVRKGLRNLQLCETAITVGLQMMVGEWIMRLGRLKCITEEPRDYKL